MFPYSMQKISLFQLRYFVSVVKNASFSKAAVECLVAQTAISQQISNLEETLGFTLLERNNKHVKLTNIGKIFYEDIYGIMLTLENAFLEIEQVSTNKFLNKKDLSSPQYNYNIQIGYYGGWEKLILPTIVYLFKLKYPGATATFNFIMPHNIIDALSQNIVDIAFTSAIHKFSLHNIKYMVIDKSPVNLLVPFDHHLANCKSVSINDLSCEYFVPLSQPTNENHYTNFVYNNVVTADRFSAMVPYLDSSMQNALLSVESGLGVCFFPEAVKYYKESPKVRFLPLKEQTMPVTMHCAWKSNTDNEALLPFIATIRECISKIGSKENPLLPYTAKKSK